MTLQSQITRLTSTLSLVSCAVEHVAFVNNCPAGQHFIRSTRAASGRGTMAQQWCHGRTAMPPRTARLRSALRMTAGSEGRLVEGQTKRSGSDCKDGARNAKDSLREAFGAGQGKHASKKRRRHSNKYAAKSKAGELDPWEQQLREAEESMGEADRLERRALDDLEARRIQRRIERGDVDYPDEEDIDPYDPSSFGYIEIGQIQGAHGVKGEVKVRSSTDFAVTRLCTPGVKHIKAPNRRFPRDIELVGGRFLKENVFLLQLEGVSTREVAAALRGHKIYALENEEVDLEEEEYMVRDLIGAQAYRADDESVYVGEVVGAVIGDEYSSTAAGLASDMLQLRLPCDQPTDVPRVCYVPFVPAFVPALRLEEGNSTILLDLPDGLLDLAVEVEEKVVIRGLLKG